MITKNYLDRSTASGTSSISQIGILGSWAHVRSNSHQIFWYLDLYTNSNDYRKWSWLSRRIRYLPYKSVWTRPILVLTCFSIIVIIRCLSKSPFFWYNFFKYNIINSNYSIIYQVLVHLNDISLLLIYESFPSICSSSKFPWIELYFSCKSTV